MQAFLSLRVSQKIGRLSCCFSRASSCFLVACISHAIQDVLSLPLAPLPSLPAHLKVFISKHSPSSYPSSSACSRGTPGVPILIGLSCTSMSAAGLRRLQAQLFFLRRLCTSDVTLFSLPQALEALPFWSASWGSCPVECSAPLASH